MREDMAKVIVERPRILQGCSRHGSSRRGRTVPMDDLPAKQSMRRHHVERGGYKMLNENLAPLRRFLEKQVGRKWDDVYSEISERLRPDNAVQQHVRDHIRDFVAVDPKCRNYTTFLRGAGCGGASYDNGWYQMLYVDPADGILKRTADLPSEKADQRERAENRRSKAIVGRVPLGLRRELRMIDGIWYDITLSRLPEARYDDAVETRLIPLKRYRMRGPAVTMEVKFRRLISPKVFDALGGFYMRVGPEVDNTESWKAFLTANPNRVYASARRQLSRRELRRFGLENASWANISARAATRDRSDWRKRFG